MSVISDNHILKFSLLLKLKYGSKYPLFTIFLLEEEKNMIKIAVIIGSTRPGRNGKVVADWVCEIANQRTDAIFELVDIKDYHLPLLDEEKPAAMGNYKQDHTIAWAKKINDFDGFIFVTPEYNKATSGALKNAIDYLYKEWNHKAAGFVGYGMSGGNGAVENLRLIMGELMIADVRSQVEISFYTDFENFEFFKPASYQEKVIHTMLNEIITWSGALKELRKNESTSKELYDMKKY